MSHIVYQNNNNNNDVFSRLLSQLFNSAFFSFVAKIEDMFILLEDI
jgi:hypothetical protein